MGVLSLYNSGNSNSHNNNMKQTLHRSSFKHGDEVLGDNYSLFLLVFSNLCSQHEA